MGPAMTEAYHGAAKAADGIFKFAKDHPFATAGLRTLIAVGVLVLLAPWVVEALGFAEFGLVEDKYISLPASS